MYRALRLAVVIPAFNERSKIVETVATVPAFVDHVLVIDDASRDDTAAEAARAALGRDEPARVEVIRHPTNRGVGAAITTGYRHVFDSQCGYTAIHRRALETIALDDLFPRYGYPNDLLSRLHVANMRVRDVRVRPIYGAAWRSGIHLGNALHPIPWVLLRSWGNRIAAQVRRRVQARVDRLAPTRARAGVVPTAP